jgi:hypothetical protein
MRQLEMMMKERSLYVLLVLFPLFFRYSTNNTNIKMRSYLQQLDRFIFSKERRRRKKRIIFFL